MYKFAEKRNIEDLDAKKGQFYGNEKSFAYLDKNNKLFTILTSNLFKKDCKPVFTHLLENEHSIVDFHCSDNLLISTGNEAKLYSLTGTFIKTIYRSQVSIEKLLSVHSNDDTNYAVLYLQDNQLVRIDMNDINKIKVFSIKNKINKITSSLDGSFVLTSDSENELGIWSLEEEDFKKDQVIRNLLHTQYQNIEANPDHIHFAITNKDGNVAMVERNSWKVVDILNIKHSVFAYYKNAIYIAYLQDDNLCLWDTYKNKLILKVFVPKCESIIVSQGSSSTIIIITKDGSLSTFSTLVKAKEQKPTTSSISAAKGKMKIDDSEDEEDEVVKREDYALKKEKNDLDDLFDMPSDNQENDDLDINGQNEYSDDTDFIVDDDGAGYKAAFDTEDQIEDYYNKGTKSLLKKLHKTSNNNNVRFADEEDIKTQSVIQPGTTRVQGDRFYLAFSMHGIVYSVKSDDDYQSISVEFHDEKKPVYLKDFDKFTMAALNTNAVFFASNGSPGSSTKILYQPIADFHSSSWKFEFDDDEFVKCIALTSLGPAVATTKGYLRMFTNSGIQSRIMCIDGPIIGLAGSDNTLLVIFQEGKSFQGHIPLSYKLYRSNGKLMASGAVPLSADSTLQWLGLTSLGNPVIYDSAGVLKMMFPYDGNSWVPVLEIKDKQSVFWPIGVDETKLLYIECAPGKPYPGFPKPLVSEIEFKMPFLSIKSSSIDNEEKFIRSVLFDDHKKNAINDEIADEDVDKYNEGIKQPTDKLLLNLIMGGCKSGEVDKCVDFCQMLTTPGYIDAAIKMALHFNYNGIAQKFADIKSDKLSEQGSKRDNIFGDYRKSKLTKI